MMFQVLLLFNLHFFLMSKFLSLLRSKKFWTLIAAIVAALAAYFGVSCTGMVKIQRSGIHHDTVETKQVIRSKNFSTWQALSDLRSIPDIGVRTKSFGISTSTVIPKMRTGSICTSFSCFKTSSMIPVSQLSQILSTPFDVSVLPMIIQSPVNCSPTILNTSSSFPKTPFGALSLALLLPAVPLKKRRGGRRGKPRPRIKTVPLGGSHL